MKHRGWSSALVLVVSFGIADARAEDKPAATAQNVILFLVDGLRWQEVFTGAEDALMNKDNGVADVEAAKKEYWRNTPEARREALMPFLWKTLVPHGQVFGNQDKGSVVRVSNTFRFSYPGHSEMLVGYADPRINSNDAVPNPNVSVLEWLNGRPAFRGRVAAFGMWDVVSAILNRERCGFYVNGGYEPVTEGKITPQQELLNRLKAELPPNCRKGDYDALLFYSALEYLTANRPRVFYIAFDEIDEWGHEGRYRDYLDSTRRTDRLIGALWQTVQSMPGYRDRTTLIVATDHGRGSGAEWKGHGEKIAGAQNVWVAAIGPGVPPLGERTNTEPLTLAQVAATVAAAIGEDYRAAVPQAAPAIRLTPRKANSRPAPPAAAAAAPRSPAHD